MPSESAVAACIRRYAAADVSLLRSIKHAQQSDLFIAQNGRPARNVRRATAAKKLVATKLKSLAAQCAAAIDGFVAAEMDQRNRHQSNLEEFGAS